jgi:hypothetical protein
MKYWSKSRAYLGAATLYFPRVIIEVGSMILLVIFLRITMIGFKIGDKPITGWRKHTTMYAYKLCSGTVQSSCGGSYKLIDQPDFDYSKWLGKDYLKTQKLPEKASIIVANHQTWFDSPVLISTLYPGFTISDEARRVPILKDMVDYL